MPAPPDKILQLRQLLAKRYGRADLLADEVFSFGLPALDEVGIPRAALTKVGLFGTGDALLLYGLLHAALEARDCNLIQDPLVPKLSMNIEVTKENQCTRLTSQRVAANRRVLNCHSACLTAKGDACSSRRMSDYNYSYTLFSSGVSKSILLKLTKLLQKTDDGLRFIGRFTLQQPNCQGFYPRLIWNLGITEKIA